MDREDIVQMPRDVVRGDLPAQIEAGKPFNVNGCLYVCERSGGSMKICAENGDKTSVPRMSRSFYVIRKL